MKTQNTIPTIQPTDSYKELGGLFGASRLTFRSTQPSTHIATTHFDQSQRFENSGELEDARYELATAEEYRDMYWYRVESEARATRNG